MGLVGVNTSHATAFAKVIRDLPEATMSWVWGGQSRPDQPDAPTLAREHGIETVVAEPTDLIAETDLVLIVDDTGGGASHAELARPFLEAGVPTFIDKPMTLDIVEAQALFAYGTPLTSSSALRFSAELADAPLAELGALSSVVSVGPGEWFYYGIHAVEQLFAVAGGGVDWVQRTAFPQRDVAIIGYGDGRTAIVKTLRDTSYAFVLTAHGANGWLTVETKDFEAFYRGQVVSAVEMARTAVPPVPPAQTLELLAVLRAGELSAECDGARVALAEAMG